MKKKKVSLKEKIRRSKQNDSGELFLDGEGSFFTMKKVGKNAHQLQ